MNLSNESKKLAALLIVAIYNCLFLPQLSIVIQMDLAVNRFFMTHHTPTLNSIMNFFSTIGGSYGFVIFLFAYACAHLFKGGKYRPMTLGIVIFILLKLANYWLKLLFARARPESAFGIIDTYSMPSGHAANAALMFGTIIVMTFKSQLRKSYKYLIYALSFICIIGVASSRVYLGVHFLSDVIMGALWTAIAVAILAISYPEIFVLKAKS